MKQFVIELRDKSGVRDQFTVWADDKFSALQKGRSLSMWRPLHDTCDVSVAGEVDNKG